LGPDALEVCRRLNEWCIPHFERRKG